MLTRPISSEPWNRMNPRYKVEVWLGVRNNSAECFVGTAEGAREVMRIEHQDTWDKEAINNVIGVPWKIVVGKWTLGSRRHKLTPCHHHQCRLRLLKCRGRITRTDVEAFGTIAGCPGCTAIRSGKRFSPAEPGLMNVSKQLQKVQSVKIEEARC